MKRKRRSFKWVGVTACAVLLCAWIGTFWSAFGYRAGTVVVDLSVGCFEVSVYPKGTPTQGWFARGSPTRHLGCPGSSAAVSDPRQQRTSLFHFGCRYWLLQRRRSWHSDMTGDLRRDTVRNVASTCATTTRSVAPNAAGDGMVWYKILS